MLTWLEAEQRFAHDVERHPLGLHVEVQFLPLYPVLERMGSVSDHRLEVAAKFLAVKSRLHHAARTAVLCPFLGQ